MNEPVAIFVETEQKIVRQQPEMASTAHISGLLASLGLSGAVQEEVWVIAIDGGRNVRIVSRVAKGGYHDCDVSLPTILAAVVASHTDRFILAHNHPSGQMTPTNYDFDLTWRISDAADLLDLIFEDHVIVGPGDDWYSLRGHKQMRPMRGKSKVSS